MRRRLAGVQPTGLAGLRLAPLLLFAAVAGALSLLDPVSATELLAVAGAVFALAGAALPDTAAPLLASLCLVAGYAVATAALTPAERVATAVGVAAALWALHLSHALSASVPRGTRLTAALLRHWARQYGLTLGVSVPLVVAAAAGGSLAGGSLSGDPAWARGVGAAAALLLASAPLLLVRRLTRGGGAAPAGD